MDASNYSEKRFNEVKDAVRKATEKQSLLKKKTFNMPSSGRLKA